MAKVLLFSDFGVDDVITVLYGYYSEEVEIVAIVADYGNVSKRTAIRNAQFLSSILKVELPLIGGASQPMTAIDQEVFPDIHGPVGLGPFIPAEDGNDYVLENFFKVKEVMDEYGKDLTIVSVGRLTSLATSYLLYEETMRNVGRIIIMGGAFNVPGNITPVAEANVFSDPVAANIIFELSTIPIDIIPLDVTMKALLKPEFVEELDDYYVKVDDPVGQLIAPMINYYYEFYSKSNPGIEGSPIHDLVALWATQRNAKIEYTKVPVKVSTQRGCSFGATFGDFRQTPDKEFWPVHRIATSIDVNAYLSQIMSEFKSKS
ncbi:nucleoside hydrolase [Mangrovibacillus cuniculi]|uniref:Nucleoside hydrolase n=1 Tax=Mangrovibacillus cuniculi TaxID=2593652 RepID=A0A7S8CB85_9BACI|nr:nucleoside hydrolase [Mangrovibacillus cuniculi]QPC46618.1 nucleoside hydrolase [Mangrovibacillus cuniculi]